MEAACLGADATPRQAAQPVEVGRKVTRGVGLRMMSPPQSAIRSRIVHLQPSAYPAVGSTGVAGNQSHLLAIAPLFVVHTDSVGASVIQRLLSQFVVRGKRVSHGAGSRLRRSTLSALATSALGRLGVDQWVCIMEAVRARHE